MYQQFLEQNLWSTYDRKWKQSRKRSFGLAYQEEIYHETRRLSARNKKQVKLCKYSSESHSNYCSLFVKSSENPSLELGKNTIMLEVVKMVSGLTITYCTHFLIYCERAELKWLWFLLPISFAAVDMEYQEVVLGVEIKGDTSLSSTHPTKPFPF